VRGKLSGRIARTRAGTPSLAAETAGGVTPKRVLEQRRRIAVSSSTP